MSRSIRSLAKAILLRTLPLQYIRLIRFILKAQWRVEQLERNVQRLAALAAHEQYGSMAPEQACKSVINRHEFGVYSQNGEDGILLYIFSQIGTTNRSLDRKSTRLNSSHV